MSCGGVRTAPEEIEAVLRTHPAVRQAVVAARGAGGSGPVPVAILVLEPGATLTLEELHAFLDGRLARAKWPRAMEVRSDVPGTWTGKTGRPPWTGSQPS
jgi:long-chain acyl-CoA synthetase